MTSLLCLAVSMVTDVFSLSMSRSWIVVPSLVTIPFLSFFPLGFPSRPRRVLRPGRGPQDHRAARIVVEEAHHHLIDWAPAGRSTRARLPASGVASRAQTALLLRVDPREDDLDPELLVGIFLGTATTPICRPVTAGESPAAGVSRISSLQRTPRARARTARRSASPTRRPGGGAPSPASCR